MYVSILRSKQDNQGGTLNKELVIVLRACCRADGIDQSGGGRCSVAAVYRGGGTCSTWMKRN